MIYSIQAERYDSAAAMVEAYAARRARLFGKPTQERAEQPTEPQQRETAVVITYRDRNPKDAHVRAWEAWRAEMGSPCKAHIKRRCEEMGIPYATLIGPDRHRQFCKARQLLMWEIKTIIKPTVSWPELGRLFGGRDHTTAIHAVRKIAAQKARGE